MVPGQYDFDVYQGSKYTTTVTWEDESGSPVDNSGWHAKLQIRTSPYDVWDIEPPYVTIEDGDGITLGGTDGTISIVIGSDRTSALPSGEAVYDLFMIAPDGSADSILRGRINITPRVTVLP